MSIDGCCQCCIDAQAITHTYIQPSNRRSLPHWIPPHILKGLQEATSQSVAFSHSLSRPPLCLDIILPILTTSNVSIRFNRTERAHREPWFGPHHARDIYVSLLSMDPPPPRNVLVSALIRRAITDIQRVMEIRENKAALQNLLTKGQIGDDTWNHLLETEKEMDSELYEVVQEANHFRPGWGQYIFPHAGDMIQHEKNKKLFDGIEEERKRLGGF